MATEIWKSVEIDGEQYSLRKFTATEGLQFVRLLLEKISPLIPTLSGDDELLSETGVYQLMKMFGSISDADVETIVKKCLKNAFKVLPAGNQAVMDSAGRYGVEDLEYDLLKTCKLCWEVIQWGCSDFFGEKGSALASMAMSRLTSRQNQQTMTPSSLPQS